MHDVRYLFELYVLFLNIGINVITYTHTFVGMISGSSVIGKYILVSLTLFLSCGCLGMRFYTSWQHFTNMISPAQMTITARTASKVCARTPSECPEICVQVLIS